MICNTRNHALALCCEYSSKVGAGHVGRLGAHPGKFSLMSDLLFLTCFALMHGSTHTGPASFG